jgi:membrane protein implicated in regulation of membrane protease activity
MACHMTDRFLSTAWRGCVLIMIALLALAAAAIAYGGVFGLISGLWAQTIVSAVVAIIAAVAVKWLCDHRDELVRG